jgi:hypothetical protein
MPTMADNVRMLCPNLQCRAVLAVPGSARGQVVRCRKCGTRVKVPPTLAMPSAEESAPQKPGAPVPPPAA